LNARPMERVTGALEAAGCRTARAWRCPAHDDRTPSLSVKEGDDRVLLYCHAGCSPEDVVGALGLEMRDLFAGDAPKSSDWDQVATYDYQGEDGELLFQVVRLHPKAFRQRRPDGNGGWAWNLNGIRRVPYRLPQVCEAVQRSQTIYVVEGEKDVHALEAAGAVATTNPGGAGKWRDEYSAHFRGARVVVVEDADEAGRNHALAIVEALTGIAAEIRHVAPATGKDATDHLGAGRGLADFTPIFEQQLLIRASDLVPEQIDWLWPSFVPLAMPTVLGGFPGVGKTTILYDLAARTSRDGKAVLVATAEDHLAAVVRPRLEAARADLELVHMVVAPITLPESVGLLKRLVEEKGAALLVLDPLVAFVGDAVNTHRDHHVRRVLAPLAKLAEDTGAAVVVVIHTNKGEGHPLMRISGSVGFTGAARSVLLAADDPQKEDRRILAVIKANLAETPPPLAYNLTGVSLDGGISTSRVDWLGEAPEVDVQSLLTRSSPEERTQVEEAMEFLVESEITEKPRPVRDIEKAAESLGISGKTLQRARKRLGIPAWKEGEWPGVWHWGPRPLDPDTRSGHVTPVQMSKSARPAETPVDSPDLDRGSGVRAATEDALPSPDEIARIAELHGWPRLRVGARLYGPGEGPWRAMLTRPHAAEQIRPLLDELANLDGQPVSLSDAEQSIRSAFTVED
jgi:putative DNA primase/helicase